MRKFCNKSEFVMKKTASENKITKTLRDTMSDTNDLFIISVLRDYCYEFVHFVDSNLECEFYKSQA